MKRRRQKSPKLILINYFITQQLKLTSTYMYIVKYSTVAPFISDPLRYEINAVINKLEE